MAMAVPDLFDFAAFAAAFAAAAAAFACDLAAAAAALAAAFCCLAERAGATKVAVLAAGVAAAVETTGATATLATGAVEIGVRVLASEVGWSDARSVDVVTDELVTLDVVVGTVVDAGKEVSKFFDNTGKTGAVGAVFVGVLPFG